MKKDIFLILLGVFSGAIFSGVIFLVTSPPRGQPLVINDPPTPAPIFIDISGCVNDPGVYPLASSSRVADAVEAASGLTKDADIDHVNLSKRIYDEDKIFIPSIHTVSGDISNGNMYPTGTLSQNSEEQYLININTASRQDLQKLPGIGSQKATDIIEYREINGMFDKIEDIQNVSGIGPAIFSEIQQFITVRNN